MSIVRYHPPQHSSKAELINAAVLRLYDILCSHVFVCCWILYAQVRLHLLSPTAGVFLMNVNLLWLAERSWKVQSRTMHIWHPIVQLFFCVARVVHGAGVILAACVWIKIVILCGRERFCQL